MKVNRIKIKTAAVSYKKGVACFVFLVLLQLITSQKCLFKLIIENPV